MRGYGLLFAAIAVNAACTNFSDDDHVNPVVLVGTSGSAVYFPPGQVVTVTLPVGPVGGSGSGLPEADYGVAGIMDVSGDLRDPNAYVFIGTNASGYYTMTGLFPTPSDGSMGGGHATPTYASWTTDLGLTSTEVSHLGQYVDSYTIPSSPGSGGSNVDYPTFCTWAGVKGPLSRYDQEGEQRSAVDLTTGNDSRLIVVDGVSSEPISTYAWCASGVPSGVQNQAVNTHGTSNTSPRWLSFTQNQAWCYLAGLSSNGVNNYVTEANVSVENDAGVSKWQVTGTQAEANCLKPL